MCFICWEKEEVNYNNDDNDNYVVVENLNNWSN
jgi:hypothetical protein